MRFSTIAMPLFLVASASAAAIDKRDAVVTVHTDGASTQVTVPTAELTADPPAGNLGGKADVASAVGNVISKVVHLIQGMIDDDIKRRQAFTQNVVARVREQTKYNVIMSNVGYDFQGDFIDRTSTKYNAKIGADVSYDVITFKTGTFTLKGDGGYENVSKKT
ncbi:hypothetical protein CFIO01_04163 [Colletotrichum fioriniae PJ7]|uniref:Uncharacterized protein n=1 Tax=Colletotrichum fioriniae PJ7 TaxID=1445577 RepID=A0A010RJC7_9PEZI|nr:hypothetical protein CFIO01_04163 [Colletotrichum fioriniae PJ7]